MVLDGREWRARLMQRDGGGSGSTKMRARFERGGDGDCELRRCRDGAGDYDGVRRARTMRLASNWTTMLCRRLRRHAAAMERRHGRRSGRRDCAGADDGVGR